MKLDGGGNDPAMPAVLSRLLVDEGREEEQEQKSRSEMR
jgi:hypothetical protein